MQPSQRRSDLSTQRRNESMTIPITQTDDAVIQLLMHQGPMGISDMQHQLGVTATAVRQRLNRLMENGFIDRFKESVGRGRPVHVYRLTKAGINTAGNNLADLARALWSEIGTVCDEQTRQRIMAGTVQRLSEQYERFVDGDTVEERLNSTAKIFSDRDIPITVEEKDGLPVLKILACPYPDVGDNAHDICEMEKQLFSKVVGEEVVLCECRKEGDACCTYTTNKKSSNFEKSK